jgi:cell division septum initiation protein DivIVA
VDVQDKLDELIKVVENARAMPMSASCILNRSEVLGMLGEIKELLPEEFRHAQLLLRDREAVIEDGRREAERMLAGAREQRGSLVSDTEVAREAQIRAEQLKSEAMQEAYAIRQEVDDYVDQKLANFEVVLNKTLTAVHRGREKLRGRQEMDALGEHVEAVEGGRVGEERRFLDQ